MSKVHAIISQQVISLTLLRHQTVIFYITTLNKIRGTLSLRHPKKKKQERRFVASIKLALF